MSDLVFAHNFSVTRKLPGEAEKGVKRSERSNGPDTALYKNYF